MIPISQPIITDDEIEAAVKVLRSGQIAEGPVVAELEKRFAQYCGTKFAVAMNSGTAAIHAGLHALGLGAGDEVITTPFTFAATANPALIMGAKVIFADIRESDFLIDPNEVAKKISSKTRVIIPVDLFGQSYPLNEIKKAIGNQKDSRSKFQRNKVGPIGDIKILEDACQAVGAKYYGKMAGNLGDIAAFSFYATKNMMSGEGGMATTNNAKYAELMRRFRHHGQDRTKRYQYLNVGLNYRMLDLTAAIALAQLAKIDGYNDKRIENARLLSEGLANITGLILPTINSGNRHVFHQFTIRVTNDFPISRDRLIDYLKAKGIGSGIYYPNPLHLQPQFKRFGYKKGDFLVTEKISQEALSLPIHPLVAKTDIEYIVKEIKESTKART